MPLLQSGYERLLARRGITCRPWRTEHSTSRACSSILLKITTSSCISANDRLKNQDQDLVMPGFGPARSLFDDLQRTYADTFRIFFDPYGGDTYGAVWDPTLKEPRPFRVLGGYSSVPAKKVCILAPTARYVADTLTQDKEKGKDKGLVALNDSGVVGEIERLGSGVIKSVTKQR